MKRGALNQVQGGFIRSQKGAALLSALFLTVILSFLALSLSQLGSRSAARAITSRSVSETYWRAIGVETLAKTVIMEAVRAQDNYLSSENPLFAQVYELPMEGASANIAFADQTRCLNLNSFSVATESSNRSPLNTAARDELIAYAEPFGVSPTNAARMASVIADWVDADSFQEAGGAEDGVYTALPTPYRTGGVLLADVSEIRAMLEVEAELYRQLSPLLCARPQREPLKVNVNMLTGTDAPLVSAIFGEAMNGFEAEELIASIPPGGYSVLADFISAPSVRAMEDRIDVNTLIEERFDVSSSYIAMRGVIDADEGALELTILFKVEGEDVEVISRRIGRRT